ncbi:MAG: SDR family oxidoreductase [Gammaproteobacteria bacterium]|nr:SDR family oxidoreductase [Gammaproteobacteria bacterium]
MKNKIVLVTGAASGIGAEVARQSSAAGARVAICDVNEAAGSLLADELRAEYITCDVASLASMAKAVDECANRLGQPDFVHLNAGVMTVPPADPFIALEEVSEDQYQRIVGVNLAGVFHGLKATLPRMRETGGAITITASIAGLITVPFDPLYTATKHAVIGLARSVAASTEGTDLRVNVICPGGVDTAIIPDALRAAGAMDPMPPSVMAAEVLDLLQNGSNGEVRVKMATDRPAFQIQMPELDA